MRKYLTSFGFIAVALVAAAVVFAGVANQPPDQVVLDKAADKKAPVTFPHKAHVEATECATCHHTQKGLTADCTDEVQPCSACHLDPEKAETPSMRQMSLKKNPFHVTCIGCHKEQAKGPAKCDDCHPKE